MRSNCLIYALTAWLKSASPRDESYLIIRRSRVRWGIFHMLHGKLDHATGQIAVTSYKPPPGHKKTKPAPFFDGHVVDGDK
jgi:hypothetical protein